MQARRQRKEQTGPKNLKLLVPENYKMYLEENRIRFQLYPDRKKAEQQ